MSKQNKQQNKLKAEGIVNKLLASELVANLKCGLAILKSLIEIYTPLAIAVYILHTQDDKLVLALGVASGIISVINNVKAVATAVKSKTSNKIS